MGEQVATDAFHDELGGWLGAEDANIHPAKAEAGGSHFEADGNVALLVVKQFDVPDSRIIGWLGREFQPQVAGGATHRPLRVGKRRHQGGIKFSELVNIRPGGRG